MAPDEAVGHVARVAAVPDSSFFDIASELVPAIDRVHFNGLGLEQDMALRLRTLLADRLIQSLGWRRERDRSELRVEISDRLCHRRAVLQQLWLSRWCVLLPD